MTKPQPPIQTLIERVKKSAERVNSITNRALRESATVIEAKRLQRLGIAPHEFRRLLRA